ncbi:MAG TPA: hypothetical protein VMU02_02215 [bacterium]|nr:hypothetical protein [bacterium]
MEPTKTDTHDDLACNVILAMESARDLIAEMKSLLRSLEEGLNDSREIDSIVAILEKKKAKVDILKDLAVQIKAQILAARSEDGRTTLPDSVRLGFLELMAEFQNLIEEEARIENLICGQGLPISKRTRS